MSWNTTGFFIRSQDVSGISERLGFDRRRVAREIDGEAAFGVEVEGLAVGRVGPWTAVVSRAAFPLGSGSDGASFWSPDVHALLLELSTEARVVSFVLQDATETYGFAIYDRGAQVRAWLSDNDEVTVDSGTPVREPEDRNDAIPLGVVFHKLEVEVASMQRVMALPFVELARRQDA